MLPSPSSKAGPALDAENFEAAELTTENERQPPGLVCGPQLVEAGYADSTRQSQRSGMFKVLARHHRQSAATQKTELEIDEYHSSEGIAPEEQTHDEDRKEEHRDGENSRQDHDEN